MVSSAIPATMATVRMGWSSLAIPVLLVTVQLLGLAWLLLFLLVAETAAAQGPESALAKLRGQGRWRTVTSGLSEPLLLLAVALPVGAMVGWPPTVLLGHALLLPRTPVGFPAAGWAAAGAATAGGLAAVIVASQSTLRRPVLEQWRRSDRRTTDRSWVADAVLVTGAGAGLAELVTSGQVTSAHHNALSLLVPGLLGVAVAVVASRLLPLACSAAICRRRGGLAAFLALRHVARRPGGSRTTVMLGTSFALATFAVSAWAVGQTNYRLVAAAQIGAPTVLTVTAPPGGDLGALVAKADPSGRVATPVEEYAANNAVTLAVDPAAFNRIAGWPASPLAPAAVRSLDPPSAPPLVLDGDAVRIHLTIAPLQPAGRVLTLDVLTPTNVAPTPVSFRALPPRGAATEAAALTGCPCTWRT